MCLFERGGREGTAISKKPLFCLQSKKTRKNVRFFLKNRKRVIFPKIVSGGGGEGGERRSKNSLNKTKYEPIYFETIPNYSKCPRQMAKGHY